MIDILALRQHYFMTTCPSLNDYGAFISFEPTSGHQCPCSWISPCSLRSASDCSDLRLSPSVWADLGPGLRKKERNSSKRVLSDYDTQSNRRVCAYLTEPVWPARLRYQLCGLARSESPGSDGHWFACTAELGWCLSSTPNTHNNISLDLFHSKIIHAKEFKAKHEELL